MAESFVDSYKTELIADRVWRSHTQLEIATVEYVAWFNTRRLHSSLGNIPPLEHEANWGDALASQPTGQQPPAAQLTLNAPRVYEPSGLVSAVQDRIIHTNTI